MRSANEEMASIQIHRPSVGLNPGGDAIVDANALAEDFEILIADDSPIDRKLLERALSGGRYPVLVAKSGQEAMAAFAKHRPALVVTDWMMPDLTGIELCKRIRREFQESYTYIIILTGMTEKNEVVKGLAAGADDYLTKPFHANEFLARLEVGRRIVGLQRQLETKNRLLEELALTDALTGLPNRRAVEGWAIRELSAAARHEFPFWVVMADLDHFKSVNDKYGHDAGDTVLKRFADILKSGTRSSDICGRIGGEEFLIVLTHVQKAGARLAIDRIRERFASQSFLFGGQEVKVTASFGIAEHSRHLSQNFTRLMTQADVALYSAKGLGRNRLEIAVPELNYGPGQPAGEIAQI
jgi:diguanylate cyclase (GGDEF)-like protein